MPTHKSDLSRLNLNKLVEITGMTSRTIKKRLGGLDPVEKDGRSLLYLTKEALPLIYCPDDFDDEIEKLDLTQERALLAREQRIAQTLKNEETKRNLIPLDLAISLIVAQNLAIKSALRGLPSKAKTKIPGLTAAAVQKMRRLIDGVLQNLTDNVLPKSIEASED